LVLYAVFENFAGFENGHRRRGNLHRFVRFMRIAAKPWLATANREDTEIPQFYAIAVNKMFADRIHQQLDHIAHHGWIAIEALGKMLD